jgi:hypothetical protein
MAMGTATSHSAAKACAAVIVFLHYLQLTAEREKRAREQNLK